MNYQQNIFKINVDIRNSGQFFACCGLFELAHRMWPGSEGWFDDSRGLFQIQANTSSKDPLKEIIDNLVRCNIKGLSDEERNELEKLQSELKSVKKTEKNRKAKLNSEKENRRNELSKKSREGAIILGEPFSILLDWWDSEEEIPPPKTWAGRQENYRIAIACQSSIKNITCLDNILDFHTIIRYQPQSNNKNKKDKKVEPFYFDSRRIAHRLDIGFSLDAVESETESYPAVEILALIGLQRFRPQIIKDSNSYIYLTWNKPLSISVASAVAYGCVPFLSSNSYCFSLKFRDDQKRYKAFGFSKLIGKVIKNNN